MNQYWAEVKLGLLCEKAQKVKKKEQVPSDSFLYLDIGGIDNSSNKIIGHKNFFWEDAPSRAQQIVKHGDVLFSTVRTYLKNIAQVKNPLYDGQICSSGFTVIRGKQDLVNSDFIFFYSISNVFIQPLNDLQTGSSYPAVRDKDVFAQTLPLPPLPEQRAIVSKLEQLFSELEDGVANLQKAQRQLKVYRQAVLKKAFEGELTREWRAQQTGLTTAEELLEQIQAERERYHEQQLAEWKQAVANWEADGKVGKKPRKPKRDEVPQIDETTESNMESNLPDSWKKVYIGDVFSVHVGATPSRKKANYWDGEISWVSSGEVAFKNITQTKEKISKIGLENTSTIVHPPGTVMVGMIGEGKTRGQAAILKIRAAHNQNTAAIRTDLSKCSSRYIYYFLMGNYERTRRVGSGNNQKALNKTRIQLLKFPLSPTEEQHQIVQEIESRLSVCDQLEKDIEANLKRAERLRQGLLQKAFAGELLTEAELQACRAAPDWEPAERLLERIKGEGK